MNVLGNVVALLIFPGGLFVLILGLLFEWVDRKLVAQMQNRVGPRWFQPFADTMKLLAKEEVVPCDLDARLFIALPIVALAGALTAALYVPMAGLASSFSFTGDLIVTLYLLSLLSICLGIGGANTSDRFSLMGATRGLTQVFSYEAPFLLALLIPAILAGSWEISHVAQYAQNQILGLTQPIGFFIALIGLMGKLELPPFDAPEAESEIVAGALTEYSGRGYALFRLARAVELVIGLTLIAAFYLGGLGNPVEFFVKTIGLLVFIAVIQSLFARFRIDQTVGLWWRYGALIALLQLLAMIVWKGFTPV